MNLRWTLTLIGNKRETLILEEIHRRRRKKLQNEIPFKISCSIFLEDSQDRLQFQCLIRINFLESSRETQYYYVEEFSTSVVLTRCRGSFCDTLQCSTQHQTNPSDFKNMYLPF